jgi:hypothetical protein
MQKEEESKLKCVFCKQEHLIKVSGSLIFFYCVDEDIYWAIDKICHACVGLQLIHFKEKIKIYNKSKKIPVFVGMIDDNGKTVGMKIERDIDINEDENVDSLESYWKRKLDYELREMTNKPIN